MDIHADSWQRGTNQKPSLCKPFQKLLLTQRLYFFLNQSWQEIPTKYHRPLSNHIYNVPSKLSAYNETPFLPSLADIPWNLLLREIINLQQKHTHKQETGPLWGPFVVRALGNYKRALESLQDKPTHLKTKSKKKGKMHTCIESTLLTFHSAVYKKHFPLNIAVY